MTQTRFSKVPPRVIFIHCLYLAKVTPILRIGDVAPQVERLYENLKIAGSSPLYASTNYVRLLA